MIQNTPELMSQFADNCNNNREQLAHLFTLYDMAKLGYDMQEQRCKECNTEVLTANVFYASKDCPRCNVKAGDRVTNEIFTFLFSEDDFNRYLELTTPIYEREGITDVHGEYITDWLTIKGDARRELVAFILNKIMPEEMRQEFEQAQMNITHEYKIIDTIRTIFEKKTA